MCTYMSFRLTRPFKLYEKDGIFKWLDKEFLTPSQIDFMIITTKLVQL